ncbi:MAG: fibronectin type III domain-containing protein [Spirochaetaceae bacterium]|jgi:hypothetical protein|nr:fibronectin type III domain-containing protein [Spirochaetaceae bacterium]
MRKIVVLALINLTLCTGLLWAIGEETISFGGKSGWNSLIKTQNLSIMQGLRPNPVIALSSSARNTGADLALRFDEGSSGNFIDSAGNYILQVAPEDSATGSVASAGEHFAWAGKGTAVFNPGFAARLSSERPEPMVILPKSSSALFRDNNNFGNFTIEFRIYPKLAENGEQIFAWSAIKGNTPQYIQVFIEENRLHWAFENFFETDNRFIDINLRSLSRLSPNTWSHHRLSFNANRGFIEYFVNGELEDSAWVTGVGIEGGDIFTPITGLGSKLVIASRYTGLLDEFLITGSYANEADTLMTSISAGPYSNRDGVFVSPIIDLGAGKAELLKAQLKTGFYSGTGAQLINLYNGKNGTAEILFFLRASDIPFFADPHTDPQSEEAKQEIAQQMINGEVWQAVALDKHNAADLAALVQANPALQKRYLQAACVFFPSGDGVYSPYIEELQINYRPDLPPKPPAYISASPSNGSVELAWRKSADLDATGYRVYYGEASGVYYGNEPIDAGSATNLKISGLENGKLYYFSIVAYDRKDGNEYHEGGFSREVSARPRR